MSKKHKEVESRNEAFVDKVASKIWHEYPNEKNPYIAERVELHGYDLTELMQHCSYSDVFFLLFRGELPNERESNILKTLMIALINPGPRHNATRAAMNTAVGKTNPMHILPVGLSVMGGEHLGGDIIESSMRFFRKNITQDPKHIAEKFNQHLNDQNCDHEECINQYAPGFGTLYGGTDKVSRSICNTILQNCTSVESLEWGCHFLSYLSTKRISWLTTGVASAVFSDLGIHPRSGGMLFQLMSAPGLAAHGMEVMNKPFTAMPFIKDEHYAIKKD